MLNPKLTNCVDCSTVETLLKKIDVKIFNISRDMYNNLAFMLNKKISGEYLNDLLQYKRILTYKYYNSEYISKYTLEMISNKVKLLTVGAQENCLCENNVIETQIVPNFYFGNDSLEYDYNNFEIDDYTFNNNILTINYDNLNGNYLYLLFKESIGTLDEIYTNTSPVNVISDWVYMDDLIIDTYTYKVIRVNYPMEAFLDFTHYFKFI